MDGLLRHELSNACILSPSLTVRADVLRYERLVTRGTD